MVAINYWELLLLGSIAGFTIFLGLPLARLQNVSPKRKGFLNAIAIGILVFLIIDVFGHAWNSAGDVTKDTFAGKVPFVTGVTTVAALFGGLAIGLLGLVLYESRYMSGTKNAGSLTRRKGFSFQGDPAARTERIGSSGSTEIDRGSRQTEYERGEVLLHEETAYRLAMMIAIGIGAHNFSEGLAIGQSYVSGAIGLAIILIIGFGAHNATEGFGIAGPLTGLVKKPGVRFLVLAGLVGGGPTFLGTVLGSLWTSTITSVFFLSVAGGVTITSTIMARVLWSSSYYVNTGGHVSAEVIEKYIQTISTYQSVHFVFSSIVF